MSDKGCAKCANGWRLETVTRTIEGETRTYEEAVRCDCDDAYKPPEYRKQPLTETQAKRQEGNKWWTR